MLTGCGNETVTTEFESVDEGTWALVVDDNAIDRRVAGKLVGCAAGLDVQYACDGKEALRALRHGLPGIVLTDLQMPNMDGLELVDHITVNFPMIPVILITSAGSEEIAMEALQRGAASYVPKQNIESLKQVIPQVLARAKVERLRQELNQCIDRLDCRFVLKNDPMLVPLLVARLQDHLFGMKLCGDNDRIRVGVALEEALLNGLYHGNLEISSALKEDGSDSFHRLVEERRRVSPFRDRRLHVQVRLNSAEAYFSIRDDGPGFDPAGLPDPTDPENLLKASGRGLLLIRNFMDEVTYSDGGREITMVKRRSAKKSR